MAAEYDAIILDVMMPKLNGVEVLQKLRDAGVTTPVMMLTAKAQTGDRITGFNAGADDYLPKPFASAEFLARVRALTRRSSTYVPSVLTVGNVSLDCSQYDLSTPEGCIRLSNKEYQLMELFMRHPRQVFSSDHLMERIWQADSDAEIDVIWTYIGFLRKKLKQLNANVEIKTIRGAGYSLEG